MKAMDVPQSSPSAAPRGGAASLSDMPDDELRHYGGELGLDLGPAVPRSELIRLVRGRQELLLQLDREAMLDVVVWARRPVRQSASKELLARQIASIDVGSYDGLSERGLRVLAALRGVRLEPGDSPEKIARRLRHADGFWHRVSRARRSIIGSALSKMLDVPSSDSPDAYQFLPEDDASRKVSLKHEIQDRGIVGGLASRLRGAADDYLREKMDEIEARIDRKLDDIDRRLSEWRDQEVANRLRILKLTLIASVLFAVLSLGYHLVTRSSDAASNSSSTQPVRQVESKSS